MSTGSTGPSQLTFPEPEQIPIPAGLKRSGAIRRNVFHEQHTQLLGCRERDSPSGREPIGHSAVVAPRSLGHRPTAFSGKVLFGPKTPKKGSQSCSNFVLHLVVHLGCDKGATATE